jgi:flavin reductase (DIM6/NTAB) family NADH-FMN oxidoreductase RutF
MKNKVDLAHFHHLWYPAGCSLVTAKDNIITLAWQTALSFTPPMYGISVAPKRHSHGLIKEAGEFGVNFVSKDYLDKLWYCGRHSGRDVDKWEETGFTKEKAGQISSPLIEEAYAALECKVVDSVTVGDHTLFIGEVLVAKAEDSYLENLLKYKKPYQMLGNKFTTTAEELEFK